MPCKTHPDAPHGFVRDASLSEDRYVCECEFWEEPKMNETIQRLLQKAQIVPNPPGTYPRYDNVLPEQLQRYTELLVRECIKVYNDDGYHTDYLQDVKVLNHFGFKDEIEVGADIHAGDGGYSIGTKEAYEAFVKIRNKSLEETRDKGSRYE